MYFRVIGLMLIGAGIAILWFVKPAADGVIAIAGNTRTGSPTSPPCL
jgi:hypothetical protein